MLGNLIRTIIPERFRPTRYLSDRTIRATNQTVQAGPFKGMKYVHMAYFSSYIPKLLGIYEREIYPAIEQLIAKKLDLIIDIGAAEGYYAVGMAMRCPQSRVIAYEMAGDAQKLIAQMCRMNQLEGKVDIRGMCDRAALCDVLSDAASSLVVCDCEGYELILLDPARTPQLHRAHILVELHDFLVPGIFEELSERFAATHKIERIWQTDRSPEEFPYHSLYTRLLPRSYIQWAVSEWRPVKMSWLYMEPKQAAP